MTESDPVDRMSLAQWHFMSLWVHILSSFTNWGMWGEWCKKQTNTEGLVHRWSHCRLFVIRKPHFICLFFFMKTPLIYKYGSLFLLIFEHKCLREKEKGCLCATPLHSGASHRTCPRCHFHLHLRSLEVRDEAVVLSLYQSSLIEHVGRANYTD